MTIEQKKTIEVLMKKHAAAMVQLTFRRIGNQPLAEELVQETFLTACFKADTLCSHEKPNAWLYETLGYLTKREMSRAYHKYEMHYRNTDFLGKEEEFLKIEDCLPRELSENERSLLIMRIEQHMTHAEIAAVKGITETACRKQVSRALHKCRKFIENENNNTNKR